MNQPITLGLCTIAVSGILTTCEDKNATSRREVADTVARTSEEFRQVTAGPAYPGGDAFA
jgi:hypothetical protein